MIEVRHALSKLGVAQGSISSVSLLGGLRAGSIAKLAGSLKSGSGSWFKSSSAKPSTKASLGATGSIGVSVGASVGGSATPAAKASSGSLWDPRTYLKAAVNTGKDLYRSVVSSPVGMRLEFVKTIRIAF